MFTAQYNWDSGSEKSLFNSLIASSMILGVLLGCATAGKLIQFGRRKTILLGILIGAIGTGGTLIFNIWVFLVARIFQGFGYGLVCVSAPRFQEEYIPPHLTSTLQPTFVVCTTLSAVMSSLSAYALPADDASK